MPPKIVITGRPNVGKSTLFNRLAGQRLALVADTPGVTRDRREAQAMLAGTNVTLVDTAGLEEAAPDTIPGRMTASTTLAVEEAALILFCFDARSGLLPEDRHFAAWLRKSGKPVQIVVTKDEGIYGLMQEIAERLPKPEEDQESDENRPLHFAIVGRPNAGKSTLANHLLGADRLITGPEPGLTRDAISEDFEGPDGTFYRLVDTAGLRKRAKVDEGLERLATSSAIEALKRAELVVLAIDAVLGIHEQDLHIARLIEREGRACVIALTKWDSVENRAAALKTTNDRISISLSQMKGIAIIPISAETGEGIPKLLKTIRHTLELWNKRIPTSALNRWFESALEKFPPPLVEGRRLKLRYITQVKARPPTFALFGTRAEQTPDTYHRYLVNNLRDAFDMPGIPIRLHLRGTENPYAED